MIFSSLKRSFNMPTPLALPTIQTVGLWITIFLTVLFFSIPVSTSIQSITLLLAAVLISLSSSRDSFRKILFAPWCLALLGLLAVAFLACIWSPAIGAEKQLVLGKYGKLLFLPILVLGFAQADRRQLGLNAYLLAMTLTCLLSMGKQLNWIQIGPDWAKMDAGTIFRNHVMTSFMMVFAVFVAATYCLHNRGRWRYIYGLLTLCLSYQVLFINTSRTGYVLYLLALLIWFGQHCPWRMAIVGCLGASFLFAGSVMVSPVMHQRLQDAVIEWQHYKQQNQNNPVGFRLQFHSFAKELYHRHPWLGNGTGAFTYFFAKENPVPVWDHRLLEPHSQYWLILAEWGNIGFAIFMLMLGLFAYQCWRLQSLRHIAVAFLALFSVGNLSDSLLFYSGTGYLFVCIMALCLGEGFERHN